MQCKVLKKFRQFSGQLSALCEAVWAAFWKLQSRLLLVIFTNLVSFNWRDICCHGELAKLDLALTSFCSQAQGEIWWIATPLCLDWLNKTESLIQTCITSSDTLLCERKRSSTQSKNINRDKKTGLLKQQFSGDRIYKKQAYYWQVTDSVPRKCWKQKSMYCWTLPVCSQSAPVDFMTISSIWQKCQKTSVLCVNNGLLSSWQ